MNAELPDGWCSTTVSQIAEVFLGKTPAKADYASRGGLKVVKFRDLHNGSIDFSKAEAGFIRAGSGVSTGLRELRAGDVLITSAAHSGENIGKKCAYVSSLPSEFDRVFFTGELLNIRCKIDTLSRWVYHFFCSTDGYLEIQDAVTGVHLTGGRAQLMQVPLAPLAEQSRILAEIERTAARVASSQERLARSPQIARRLRQSILAAACSGRLTADWRVAHGGIERGHQLLTRIEKARRKAATSTREQNQVAEAFEEARLQIGLMETGLENIPESWEGTRIGAIGTVVNGSTPSRNQPKLWGGAIPWVSSGEVRNNVITETRERISGPGYDSCSVRLLPRGTVLLAMIGEGKTRGQTAVLDVEATINQNVAAVLIPHGLVDSRFLWRWFQFQYEATRERGSGSGPQALNCQRVRELPFVLPPLAEQVEIVRRVDELLSAAGRIERRFELASAKADKIMSSLLAKAFRGELVPTEADLAAEVGRDYETASALLERIQGNMSRPLSRERTNRPDRARRIRR